MASILEATGAPLIPEPRKWQRTAEAFSARGRLSIAAGDDPEDRFAAEFLARRLREDLDADAVAAGAPAAAVIRLTRGDALRPEGYRLRIQTDAIVIEGADAAGVYYATQTLRQCLYRNADNIRAPGLAIEDWPALKHRAIHYDTKHYQGTREYVESFIVDLAHYKVNMLVWEWEDKLAYRSYPEVGAPGAFTISEMQELARFARQHHVQIVPLVQGLGHVSFIHKHERFRHLREIPDSNWEFCPLKDGSYEVLFKLWDDAIEATPGSEFLHIGSDETYELGAGEACGCRRKAEEIGRDGLMQLFLERCVAHVEQRGRRALSWGGAWRPEGRHPPPQNMIFVDDVVHGKTHQEYFDYLRQARDARRHCWVYARNPGIVPLVVPLFPWTEQSFWPGNSVCREQQGAIRDTAHDIGRVAREGSVDGSITTSWNDSGPPNQAWMPRYVCAAEFSWNPRERDMDEWTRLFFASYFGPQARDLTEMFDALFRGADFYYHSLQRAVWHWGHLGKIQLPDFPRGDLEYSNFWRVRYEDLVHRSAAERQRTQRALDILADNMARPVRHRQDLELFQAIGGLLRHNEDLFLMLRDLEQILANASDRLHHVDNRRALAELRRMESLLERHLASRQDVYQRLVAALDASHVPKGLSLPGKPYLFARDRARHFANRTPDWRFLIMDEELLGLGDYLARLKAHNDEYARLHVRPDTAGSPRQG